jgi:hypothetical protein
MTTVLDANVHNIAVRGTFDDASASSRPCSTTWTSRTAIRLGAVNSINWARILAQTVYYFYAWGRSAAAIRRAGQLRGAHRQLRRRLRRLSGPAHGPAHRPADHRHQPQRHPDPLRRHRRLCQGRGLPHPEPGDGHPDRVQLRALPLLSARRGPGGGARAACRDGADRALQVDGERLARVQADFDARAVTTPRPWRRSARPTRPAATSSARIPPSAPARRRISPTPSCSPPRIRPSSTRPCARPSAARRRRRRRCRA